VSASQKGIAPSQPVAAPKSPAPSSAPARPPSSTPAGPPSLFTAEPPSPALAATPPSLFTAEPPSSAPAAAPSLFAVEPTPESTDAQKELAPAAGSSAYPLPSAAPSAYPLPSAAQTLKLTFKRTANLENDRRRLNDLLNLLGKYPGDDRFTITVEANGGPRHQLDFPNNHTRICRELQGELTQRLGVGTWQVEV
jgi:hypothetical protein